MRDISDMLDEFVHYLNDVPPGFAPGTGQACSNIGYTALSKIIETAKCVTHFNYHVTAVSFPSVLADTLKVWSGNRAEPANQWRRNRDTSD